MCVRQENILNSIKSTSYRIKRKKKTEKKEKDRDRARKQKAVSWSKQDGNILISFHITI